MMAKNLVMDLMVVIIVVLIKYCDVAASASSTESSIAPTSTSTSTIATTAITKPKIEFLVGTKIKKEKMNDVTEAGHSEPNMLHEVIVNKTLGVLNQNYNKRPDSNNDYIITINETAILKPDKEIKNDMDEDMEGEGGSAEISHMTFTENDMLNAVYINDTLENRDPGTYKVHEALVYEEPPETADAPDDDPCFNVSVRLCIKMDNCRWYTAKCVEATANNFYPIPPPHNLTDIIRFAKQIWTITPTKSGRTYWLTCLVMSLIIGACLTIYTTGKTLYWLGLPLVRAFQFCFCKKKKKEKKRRLVVVLPDNEDEPGGDFVIDCTKPLPSNRRIGRTEDLFKAFHANRVTKIASRKRNKTVATIKEDLECPSNSQPEETGGENSSIVTATVCRKSKVVASQSSSDGCRTISDDGANGESSQSCSQFVNPAFSAGSEVDVGMTPKHAVANDADSDDDDDEDDYMDANGNPDLPAVISSIDETAPATSANETCESVGKKGGTGVFPVKGSRNNDDLTIRKRKC